nr:hypothetical protein [uncultured Actinoplanes sp.]
MAIIDWAAVTCCAPSVPLLMRPGFAAPKVKNTQSPSGGNWEAIRFN